MSSLSIRLSNPIKTQGPILTSLSATTSELVEEALELQEDLYFSREGDRRLEELDKAKLISHKDAWK